MLRTLLFLLKVTTFAGAVLILGNTIRYDGQTVSDQVRTQLSHAETSETAHRFRDWTGKLMEDTRLGATKKLSASVAPILASAKGETAPAEPSVRRSARDTDTDRIDPSERQKLRELIRELNRSY